MNGQFWSRTHKSPHPCYIQQLPIMKLQLFCLDWTMNWNVMCQNLGTSWCWVWTDILGRQTSSDVIPQAFPSGTRSRCSPSITSVCREGFFSVRQKTQQDKCQPWAAYIS